jgi:bacterial/archaeal transporter family-2 protein
MELLFLAAALVIGGLLAVQASANLQLNAAVGTPYGASTLQLGLAAGLLAVVGLAMGSLSALRLTNDVPAWHLLGGLASPPYITSGILLFPRLGALAAVGLFVTGQVLASVGLDSFGLLGVPRQSLTTGVVFGAAAVILGIRTIIRGQRLQGTGTAGATVTRRGAAGQAGWIVLGILAGAVLPVQGAVNAQLRADLQHPVTVALISFTVATLTIGLLLVLLLLLRRTPSPKLEPLGRMPWWGWVGGVCAAVYVTATFMLIPTIGAAKTIALTVAGQQLASAVIDSRGLFRLPVRALTRPRLAGLALLSVGAALVQLT